MPIYLCQPGTATKDPWRHGVQVYERPFPLYNHRPPPTGPEQIIVVLNENNEDTNNNNNDPLLSSLSTPLDKCTALCRYLSEYTCPKEGVLVFVKSSSSSLSSGSNSDSGEEEIRPCNVFVKTLTQHGFRSASFYKDKDAMDRAVIVGEFMSGKIDVLVVDNDAEDIIKNILTSKHQQQQQPQTKIQMIVNFDLHSTTIANYTSRLSSYTSSSPSLNMILTFYSISEDGHLAKDLADVMHNFGQRIPKELKALIPPKLMTPPPKNQKRMAAASSTLSNNNVGGSNSGGGERELQNESNGDGQQQQQHQQSGRGATAAAARQNARAVPLRGDSHSPAPPEHERNNVNGNNININNELDHGEQQQRNREGGGTDTVNMGDEDGERRRRLQRQFQENHNTTVSRGSSDDDSHHNNEGGDVNTNNNPGIQQQQQQQQHQQQRVGTNYLTPPTSFSNEIRPNPVRRIRHAEVVLVDQCLVAYGRTWLRLRWPGQQGGFGGYVALSRVAAETKDTKDGGAAAAAAGAGGGKVKSGYYKVSQELMMTGGKTTGDDTVGDGGNDVDEATMPGNEENVVLCQEIKNAGGGGGTNGGGSCTTDAPTTQSSLLCKETNVYYPTSTAMKLLPLYDDGLNGQSEEGDESMVENGEGVFCRICREGIHDVNYDMEPQPDNELKRGPEAWNYDSGNAGFNLDAARAVGADRLPVSGSSAQQRQGENVPCFFATSAPGPLVVHHPTAENPLLAPCDCTGSMAFVHYLCVEQWRCRSRHPGARNGLNCETCGAEYTLPPPPSRPASRHDLMGGLGPGGGNLMAEDDWLDAMPPHVLAALRRPHPAWQLGAAVVRRRWLRPIVPVIVSPLVALYCRARRTLKKRGVSRRRWACSLCRRRARWKCVRCLRSYYCSRQCQNVSWHIVHKHVCYKPVRFWWSVVVYTLGIFLTVPNIIENFPIYDAMVTLLPINFIALGIIFGGIASSLKRSAAIDIRGRILEVIVVALTILLTAVSSGLVRAYFGDTSQCWGVWSQFTATAESDDGSEGTVLKGPFYPSVLNKVLIDVPLRQIQLWYLKWDFILSKFGFISRSFICTPGPDGNTDYSEIGCSPATRNINPQFYLEEERGQHCSADMAFVMGTWFMSLCVIVLGHVYRQIRGARRNALNAAAAAVHRGRRRPHQD